LIEYYYNKLKLNETIGCAPQTYSNIGNNGAPLSLYNLYLNEIFPTEVFVPAANIPVFFCNPFTLRDDLYQGRVTYNDILSIMPFGDETYYFTGLTGNQLQQVIGATISEESMDFLFSRYEAFTYKSEKIDARTYYHSNVTVNPSSTYDLLCSEYDTIVLGELLNKLFPNSNYQRVLYPNKKTSTVALSVYISSTWPCN